MGVSHRLTTKSIVFEDVHFDCGGGGGREGVTAAVGSFDGWRWGSDSSPTPPQSSSSSSSRPFLERALSSALERLVADRAIVPGTPPRCHGRKQARRRRTTEATHRGSGTTAGAGPDDGTALASAAGGVAAIPHQAGGASAPTARQRWRAAPLSTLPRRPRTAG